MVKFKSFFEFVENYEEEGFIDKVSTRYYPFKKLNPKQINRYYLQYVKKWNKQYGDKNLGINDEQSEDSKLSAFVRARDKECRLLKLLTKNEFDEWRSNQNGLGRILDAAHIFGKNAFPWLRYDDKNVVTLNRFSHNCLDQGKSPISGKSISLMELDSWWKRIAGDDWEYLLIQKKQKGNFKYAQK